MGRATFTLHAQDWARLRLVRSRLWETSMAVRTLVTPRQQPPQLGWLARVDIAAARRRLPMLAALHPPAGEVPDFIAPVPTGADRSLEQELAVVAAYPSEEMAADIRRSLESYPGRERSAVLEPLIASPDLARDRVVAELAWAWETLLLPFWPRVEELIDADIRFRSDRAARSGPGEMLRDLHPDVAWDGLTLTVDNVGDATVDLAGEGLTLMPSAYTWPHPIVVVGTPWPATVAYPVRGIAELWSAPAEPPGALAAVLGPTRAALLTDLATASTTTALAARHGLSPASVSRQLGLLRDAGLLTSRRHGKEVMYRRTRAATSLLGASPGSD